MKSDAELLSHDDVTPGSGSARKIINKAEEAATASILFQDAFSGRAEIGLTGNDDLSIRVSTDGDIFVPALQVERSTGRLVLHQGALLPDGAKLVNNGTTGAAGVEIEGGGNLGQVSLRLINDSSQGIAGALFTQKSTNPGIDLVDFGFQTLTQRMNVRVEARPAYIATGGGARISGFPQPRRRRRLSLSCFAQGGAHREACPSGSLHRRLSSCGGCLSGRNSCVCFGCQPWGKPGVFRRRQLAPYHGSLYRQLRRWSGKDLAPACKGLTRRSLCYAYGRLAIRMSDLALPLHDLCAF